MTRRSHTRPKSAAPQIEAPPLVPAPALAASAAKTSQRPFRVLLVDHEPQVQDLLREAVSGQQLQVTQASSLKEARAQLADEPADLVLIEPKLPDGSGMQLARELAHSRPQTQTIVITGEPSLERAIEAIRVGAADFIVKPIDLALLNASVQHAIDRHRAKQKNVARLRKLRRICQKLNEARSEVTQQVDILCNDLVTAYQELASQMQAMVQTSEFSAIVRQELDLEQLVRKVLEYVLDKAGPTNAAIFLPTGTSDFALGGYINYDCSEGSSDLVLQHLADVLAPKMAQQEGFVHITDNAELTRWLGDDAAYVADAHVLAIACRHEGEPLAVLCLFRDAQQPFPETLIETITAIAPTLADYLARIIRVHHRHMQ